MPCFALGTRATEEERSLCHRANSKFLIARENLQKGMKHKEVEKLELSEWVIFEQNNVVFLKEVVKVTT